MDRLRQDLGYAARVLAGSPAFTAVAVATLALGIGANTALFSIVNGVLLRPLPYPEPERLVHVWSTEKARGILLNPASSVSQSTVSYPDFADWRQQATAFSDLTAFRGATFSVSAGEEPVQSLALVVTSSYLDVLGMPPALGRGFLPGEDEFGRHRVAVLSHAAWTRLFGADPRAVGRTLLVNREPYTVVGVMPPAASALDRRIDLWAPLFAPPGVPVQRNDRYLRVVGRLAPGVGLARAQAEMETIAGRLGQTYPENEGVSAYLVPMHEQVTGDVKRALLVLLGAAGLVVLIACVNLANLLLARASTREREIAIRRSLGAGRGRLLGQLLTESVLLSALGGALGVVVAHWGLGVARALVGDQLPRLSEVAIDGRALGFTLGLSLASGIAFGLAPGLRLARLPLREAMGGGARGGGERAGARRLRDLLVVAETALALVLAVGAGLLVGSFQRLRTVDAGFEVDDVLSFQVSLPAAHYREDRQRVAFYQELLERVRALPGVRAAGATLTLPLGPGNRYWMQLDFEGRPAPASRQATPIVAFFQVTPGYLEAMGIPLRRGRPIRHDDVASGPRVALVDEALVRRHFGGRDPIGSRIRMGFDPDDPWLTIVGVVGDVKLDRLDEPRPPAVYTPHAQGTSGTASTMVVAVRSAGGPLPLASAVREQVRSLDKLLPVAEVATLRERFGEALGPARLNAVLVGAFAVLALALAAIGIHGVLSYAVSQRVHELGVRMALGATASDILRLVIGQGLRPVLAGIAIGLLGALAGARLLASLLYEVKPTDPPTLLAVSAALAAVALLAATAPARRAARVDPVRSLRQE